VVLLLIYSALWTLWFISQKISMFRVDFLFTIMTLVMALANFNPFIEYREAISFEVLFLIIMVHFAFCINFLLVRMTRRPNRADTSTQGYDRFLYFTLITISLIFSVRLLADSLGRGAIPVLSNFLGAQELRDAHWQSLGNISTLDRVENLLSYFAMMLVIGFPYARKHMKASFLVFFIIVVAIVEHSLSQGARASIILTLIGLSATYFSVYKFNFKKFWLLLIFGSTVFIVFAGYFYISRNQNFAMAPDFFLSLNCAGASYTELADILSPTGKAAVLSSCYFSSPPHFFHYYLETWRSSAPLAMGGYNFAILSPETFVSIRSDIFDAIRSEGFGGNPWATFARDAYIDFGWAAPLFAAMIGVALAWFAPMTGVHTYLATIRFGILACFAFFMPFMSPLVIRPIIYSMLFLAAFPVASAIFFQSSGKLRSKKAEPV
jgi:hypothetical protein